MLSIESASATAIGSFPGTDVREISRIVAGELPDFPVIPELPARGPGSDMIGRTLGILAGTANEWSAETTPTGWRLSGNTTTSLTAATRKAQSFLSEDLDAAEEVWSNHDGPIKIAVAGPWTLASCLELPNGNLVISDLGAVRDLVEAYDAAATALMGRLQRRLPHAQIVVQLDEPTANSVVTGQIPTQSGLANHSAVDSEDVRQSLSKVITTLHRADAQVVVHNCDNMPPIDLILHSKPDGIALDLTVIASEPRIDEAIGRVIDSGCTLVAGIVDVRPTSFYERRQSIINESINILLARMSRIGFPPDEIIDRLAISPGCGFSTNASLDGVKKVLTQLHECSRILRGIEPAEAGHENLLTEGL